MSVTLVDVLAAARARRAALPGELAGHLALAVADAVAAAPRSVEVDDVVLDELGAVRVTGGRAATDAAAARAVRAVLSRLHEVSTGVTPALSRAERAVSTEGTRALVRELEAALIPANRAAARRALARLHRETVRAGVDDEARAREHLGRDPRGNTGTGEPDADGRASSTDPGGHADENVPRPSTHPGIDRDVDDQRPSMRRASHAGSEDRALRARHGDGPDVDERVPSMRRAGGEGTGAPEQDGAAEALEHEPSTRVPPATEAWDGDARTPPLGSAFATPAPLDGDEPTPPAAPIEPDPPPDLADRTIIDDSVVLGFRAEKPDAEGTPPPLPDPAVSSTRPHLPSAGGTLPTRRSDVRELLSNFLVTDARDERGIRRDLVRMAGLDVTPSALPPLLDVELGGPARR